MKPSVFQCAGPPLEEVSRRPSRRAAFQPTRGDPCGLGAPPTRASLASKTYPFFFCRINLIRSPVTSMGSCPSQAMMKHKSPGRESDVRVSTGRPQRLHRRGGRTRRAYNGVC